MQANPNTDQTSLELHAIPNDRRMAEAGWDRNSLGTIVRALGDGAWLGEYFDGQRRLSVILRADRRETPEALAEAPLVTPNGQVIPLGDVIRLETHLGPNQIRRLDHRRTVTLTMDPPQTLSLEDALATIQNEIVPALKAKLPPDANIRLAGSADHLQATVTTMAKNFALALVVLYMLMAAMFRSLRDALVVVLTVPVALVGGVLGLRVLGLVAFQPLDLLTMIGFIMMVGVIVNHSILLVDRTRDAQNHGHSLEESIRLALNQRLRAILASTLTGALGALPMAVNPGPGSVIYRGLAAVNVGGVVVAMVFSLLLLPSLMRLTTPRQKALAAPADASRNRRARSRAPRKACDESNGVSDAQQNHPCRRARAAGAACLRPAPKPSRQKRRNRRRPWSRSPRPTLPTSRRATGRRAASSAAMTQSSQPAPRDGSCMSPKSARA